jgi:hypothetical protein
MCTDVVWPNLQSSSSTQAQGGVKNSDDVLKQRKDRVEQRYQTSLKEIAYLTRQNEHQLSTDSTQKSLVAAAQAAYAFAWAEMRCQRSGNYLDDMLYYNEISTLMYGSIGSRNSSNLCDQRVDLEVLSGYLARRYQYTGKHFK